jgi:hypothetical protein
MSIRSTSHLSYAIVISLNLLKQLKRSRNFRKVILNDEETLNQASYYSLKSSNQDVSLFIMVFLSRILKIRSSTFKIVGV